MGAIDPDEVHTPGIFVQRIFQGSGYEKRIERIVVTDTIPIQPGAPASIDVVSCAPLLGDTIRRILTHGSVSEVFGGKNHLF